MQNVLVIEDDRLMLKAITTILKKGGHNVLTAKDGKEAFDLIDNAIYDVVITDMVMPYATGLEIISRIRTDSLKKSIGIIVVSANGGEDNVTEAFELGADDYLKKPIMAGELLSRIQRLLETNNRNKKNNDQVPGITLQTDTALSNNNAANGSHNDMYKHEPEPEHLIPVIAPISIPVLSQLALKEPEFVQSELKQSESKQQELKEPELVQRELKQPESKQSGLKQTETKKPDLKEPELTRLELARTELKIPELTTPKLAVAGINGRDKTRMLFRSEDAMTIVELIQIKGDITNKVVYSEDNALLAKFECTRIKQTGINVKKKIENAPAIIEEEYLGQKIEDILTREAESAHAAMAESVSEGEREVAEITQARSTPIEEIKVAPVAEAGSAYVVQAAGATEGESEVVEITQIKSTPIEEIKVAPVAVVETASAVKVADVETEVADIAQVKSIPIEEIIVASESEAESAPMARDVSVSEDETEVAEIAQFISIPIEKIEVAPEEDVEIVHVKKNEIEQQLQQKISEDEVNDDAGYPGIKKAMVVIPLIELAESTKNIEKKSPIYLPKKTNKFGKYYFNMVVIIIISVVIIIGFFM